jgi:DNA-binding Xre family transcriptional regulator
MLAKRAQDAFPLGYVRTQADLAGAVAQLYMQEEKHADIREALNLTGTQLQTILRDLVAEGMPKLKRHCMTDGQVRAIYARYLRGGSIDELAAAIGFTGSAARRQMRKKKLPLRHQIGPAKTSAHAEQQAITALLMDRVHELRTARGLSVERLAYESELSMWTLHHLREQLSDPRLTTVLRLCGALRAAPGDLLGDLPLPIEPRPRLARRPAGTGADT